MSEKKVRQLALRAKKAAKDAALLTSQTKQRLLKKIATELKQNEKAIFRANKKDLIQARKKKLSSALIDRLELTPQRLQEMIDSLRQLSKLSDPVGEVVAKWRTQNSLQVEKVRIPLGVIGIIYESRPNVTIDTAALCIKSGNAVILRGGSEAFASNTILTKIVQKVLKANQLNPHLVQMVTDTSHASVQCLLAQDDAIDLIIPRGGAGLMQMVRRYSKVPILRHDRGVCHLYVDGKAHLDMALKIAFNSKAQRSATCNALETLLVDKKIAGKFLPLMLQKFFAANVEVRGDAIVRKYHSEVKRATQHDWETEYLDDIIALRVVDGLDGALEHIAKYGTLHTEAIVTDDKKRAERFLNEVLASVVLVNASTRFNDGYQLGLGAEVGISTTKLHAFGPMGLAELTTTKFRVHGKGQIRK